MIAVFKKGDDFISVFEKFLKKNRVNSGFFYGIGGFDRAELAFYDLAKKKFLKKKFLGPFEVLSLIGNVSQREEGVVIHAHAALGRKDFSTIGGHLINATVKATLEIKIEEGGMLERKFDETTGLNLLQ